jgi:hypothetical protein
VDFQGLTWVKMTLLLVVVCQPLTLAAAPSTLTKFKTEESGELPISYRSANFVEIPARLANLEIVFTRTMKSLGLREIKGSRFLVVWVDQKNDEQNKSSGWLDSFPRKISREGGRWVFTIQAQGNWAVDVEQVYRSLVICILQAQILRDATELSGDELPEPPLWLSEGLTQVLMENKRDDFADVVWRFYLAKKVPSLATVQRWTELSELGMRRSWQQAFSFWLVTQSIKSAADQKTIQVYLGSLLKDPEKLYWSDESAGQGWWLASTSQALKQRIPSYDWDQSSSRLREATFLTVTYKGQMDVHLISITELPASPAFLQVVTPVHESISQLSNLEMLGHPMIASVAKHYRAALEAWLGGNITAYAQGLRAARDQQVESTLLHEQANDFLDWFTVNYELDVDTPEYRNYAKVVEEIEDRNAEKLKR